MIKALKAIIKEMPCDINLEEDIIFYPGCGTDDCLSHVVNDDSNIIYNNLVGEIDPSEFIVNYDPEVNGLAKQIWGDDLKGKVKNFLPGNCYEVFKEIDYDILVLKDGPRFNNSDMIKKASKAVITDYEHHIDDFEDLNKHCKLKAVIIDSQIISDNLEDYKEFRTDEEIMKTESFIFKKKYSLNLSDEEILTRLKGGCGHPPKIVLKKPATLYIYQPIK